MKAAIYLLRALTNLHAGSGDVEYGVVDKLVQKDSITRFPTIYMSSIKGALREYFQENAEDKVEKLFGSSPNPNTPDQDTGTSRGSLYFISAQLLAMPRACEDGDNYYELCYGRCMHKDWLEKVKIFTGNSKWSMESFSSELNEISDKKFKKLAHELPVIARNYLENGESKNLWYEEFVPRESLFGMIVQGSEEDLKAFQDVVDGKVIQIGGNATVGYGYCLFKHIPNPSEA